MRVGFNPNKDKIQEPNEFFHQVIVPVYIPNQEEYFKDSFIILQYCLNSLFKTSHTKTYFTIVNNGSCDKVVGYLNQLYEENKIDELIHTTNIGKLNAILKGVTGQHFPLITISDADVLFLNDWQKATYEVFEAFPKTGVVSTTPSSRVLKQDTANVLVAQLFSSKLGFTNVLHPNAMALFAKSIGNIKFYNATHLKKYLTISNGTTKAVIGAGHFVATYRGTVFDLLENKYSSFALGGSSESLFLDQPVNDLGYWRLSTQGNYTCHMGNVLEPWMESMLKNNKDSRIPFGEPTFLSNTKASVYFVDWKKNIFKLLTYKPIWKLFLQYKGLTKEEAQDY
ncbi:glycosyltransferase family 2 protein [Flavobacterium sp. ALD4]|uniref:glycosyltransferase family A protein n=1 Tax=Flavobacterium sp. ALD4 TaxID=2058314 RepID=UPI000C333E2B|nr:glycosyltransferase family A protein [Flavobacterium sp. ALD4]PKH67681.1 glycosyltransferase family 2 protein [Flavobacterium sp. ALD4]